MGRGVSAEPAADAGIARARQRVMALKSLASIDIGNSLVARILPMIFRSFCCQISDVLTKMACFGASLR